MTEKRECGRCRFWWRAGSRELSHGLCMHGPPGFHRGMVGCGGQFPKMHEEEWCYQFEREHGGEDEAGEIKAGADREGG